jgi:two-component system chemotaxis sensor kinase CheA
LDNFVDTSILLDEFIDDATTHLDTAERLLLQLESESRNGEPDDKLVTSILGSLHTLKGNSGMMGFTSLQQFVHRLETVLKQVSEGELKLAIGLFEALYASFNSMRDALRKLAENAAEPLEFSDELMMLEYVSTGETFGEQDRDRRVEKKQDYSYITKKSNTLKVNFEKLDELMNLVGELVINRTTLLALETRLRDTTQDRELLSAFNESCQLIGKSAAELRESIMKARMLPIKVVFHRFNRLTRDLSSLHGKEVNLVFSGEDTELDKTVIDEIGEPLLHLIRNAIDHGIEAPAERRKAGKSPVGTIRLSARHEGNHILVRVDDDGKGISPENLVRAALAKQLISEAEAQTLSGQDALQLIFLPGFSTSSEVTETSGRGIGLDVVKKSIASFNGMIEINSTPGAGTSFNIKLPLTMAIISALMVEVAGEVFAVPLASVIESICIDNAEIHDVGDGQMIKLRDRLLPLHRTDRVLGLQRGEKKETEYVVVVGSGDKRGGLVVDRLIGQQEIVIKALDDYLGELPGIAGGTVLGDGSVSLILDITSLLEKSMRGGTDARD